jgi:GATA-binding protein
MKPPPTTAAASGRPALRSAPSGIAQLRQSVDHQAQSQTLSAQGDAMNLDDFIQPSSVGSPAGLLDEPEPPNEMRAPSHATAPAIPIRKANQSHDQNHALAHASAPPVPPIINREHEFGYVQRHVRKTSIDERRVSPLSPPSPSKRC